MSFSIADTDTEHASVEIGGAPYEVVLVEGEEVISSLFHYEAIIAARDDGPAPSALLGRRATITFRDVYHGQRSIRGIISEARSSIEPDGQNRLTIVVRPPAFRLTLGCESRVFHDASVVDIVQRVLARAGIPARWELAREYPARVYTAQYREPDWSFIGRLCEDEGIYYWFDHEGDESVLVFADHSASAPDLSGGPRIRFAVATGAAAPVETIEELGAAVQVTPTRFALGSFDPARPRFKVDVVSGAGNLEVYDAPGGGPVSPGVLAARATTMREAAAASRSTVSGIATSVRLTPGRALEVIGHPASRFDGRFLVTAVSVRVIQRRRGGAHGDRPRSDQRRQIRSAHLLGLQSALAMESSAAAQDRPLLIRFRALDSSAPFRPPRVTPRARQAGLQSGIVIGPTGAEVHPDEAGRVRVQLHWDREGDRSDTAGKWMRVAQRGTASSMLLPRIGWNVLTTNEEGSVDAPMVMSRIFDAEHPPPYTLPDNMTRTVYKTATTPGGGSFNEIRYEDKAGAQEMFVNASRDMSVLVQDAKSEDIKANASREVVVDHTLHVGSNVDETIGGDQIITIGGNETEIVGGSRVKTVGKDEESTIGGSRRLNVGGGNDASITGTRRLSVGTTQLDASLGDVKATAPMLKVRVGGALIRLTPRNIEEHVGQTVTASSIGNQLGGLAAKAASLVSFSVDVGGVVQTIGGAKLELAGAGRTIVATKSYKEMVGGAIFLKAKGTLTDEATLQSTISVKGELDASGEVVVFKAGEKIEITCGESSLTVTDGEVRIHATNIDLQGASIDASAPSIDFNL